MPLTVIRAKLLVMARDQVPSVRAPAARRHELTGKPSDHAWTSTVAKSGKLSQYPADARRARRGYAVVASLGGASQSPVLVTTT